MKLLSRYLCFDLSAGVLFVSSVETIFYLTALLYLLNTLIHLPPELKKTHKDLLAEQDSDVKFQNLARTLENVRNQRNMWHQEEKPRNRSYRIEITPERKKRSVSAPDNASDTPVLKNSSLIKGYHKF